MVTWSVEDNIKCNQVFLHLFAFPIKKKKRKKMKNKSYFISEAACVVNTGNCHVLGLSFLCFGLFCIMDYFLCFVDYY